VQRRSARGSARACLVFALSIVVASALSGKPAFALEAEYEGVKINFNNTATVGAAMRMQKRSDKLLGKLDVPGQQDLCTKDDCMSFGGDAAPNARLVAARGAFSGVNGDDGDMNYSQYDLVSATSRLNSDLKLQYGDFLGRVRGIGFFDPVNYDFEETHNNTRWQPRHTDRSNDVETRYAKDYQLLDAYLQYAFDLGERSGTFSVGKQLLRWGESNTIAVNSVSEINPPNQAYLRFPGIEVGRLFTPVPMALLSMDVFENASIELMYQFGWEPVQVDPQGSFFSDSDIIGGGKYLMSTLGQHSEDPNSEFKSNGEIALFSSTTFTLPVDDKSGQPRDGGQYGAKFSYFADWLNSGTELSFYFLNYHSRLPYVSLYAANETCIPGGNTNFVTALAACRGFNGSINVTGLGLEPLPVDTARVFLDYPEDIQMYGFSFNTNIGAYSLSAEYSFRPNLPLQVQVTDVVFSALQPAFPENDVTVNPAGGVINLPLPVIGSTIPGRRRVVPDYLSVYRNTTIQPNQLVHGYERQQVGQFDATLIRSFSGSNWLRADQIIVLLEGGFTQVYDMPSRKRLQFDGGGLNRTHASAGADGTGTVDGTPDPSRFNPTQQTAGFADDFAWGLRLLTRFEYNDVFRGVHLRPVLGYFWDVGGIAPLPVQNFVEGRKEILAGTEIQLSQALTAQLAYQWFTGGGLDNTRKDRDNLAVSMSYTF
jgi:hypothetical protein